MSKSRSAQLRKLKFIYIHMSGSSNGLLSIGHHESSIIVFKRYCCMLLWLVICHLVLIDRLESFFLLRMLLQIQLWYSETEQGSLCYICCPVRVDKAYKIRELVPQFF
jgi:hypothetical protein